MTRTPRWSLRAQASAQLLTLRIHTRQCGYTLQCGYSERSGKHQKMLHSDRLDFLMVYVLHWSFKCKQKCTMVHFELQQNVTIELQCTRHMAVTSNPGFRGHCEGLCPNKGALSSRPTSGRCWKASTRVLEPDATMTLSPIDKLLPEITRRKAGDHRNIYSPSSALSVTSILSSPSITSIMAQRPLSD